MRNNDTLNREEKRIVMNFQNRQVGCTVAIKNTHPQAERHLPKLCRDALQLYVNASNLQ